MTPGAAQIAAHALDGKLHVLAGVGVVDVWQNVYGCGEVDLDAAHLPVGDGAAGCGQRGFDGGFHAASLVLPAHLSIGGAGFAVLLGYWENGSPKKNGLPVFSRI